MDHVNRSVPDALKFLKPTGKVLQNLIFGSVQSVIGKVIPPR